MSNYNKADLVIMAGRTINSIPLDSLTDGFARKVMDMISLLKYKTVAFDFDGTLTEFKYADGSLLPCRDDGLGEYSKEHNLYDNATVLRTMQYILEELNPDDVYVLTATVPSLREKKARFISSKFQMIKPENVLQVDSAKDKLAVLTRLHDERGGTIYFVEDMAKTLLDAEEALPFVRGVHISSLLP